MISDAKVTDHFILTTSDPFLQVYQADYCKVTLEWFCVTFKSVSAIRKMLFDHYVPNLANTSWTCNMCMRVPRGTVSILLNSHIEGKC